MSRYTLIFLLSFAIFVFFLTPNVNTGDSGELATASWFLGVAHPSGYPLYLMIAKTATFLPLGNIAFRTAVVSAIFSSLSLTLICWIIYSFTASGMAALFSVTTLLVSYSYFTQSVIAKFYMLNLFLIMSLFSLWANKINVEGAASGRPQKPGDFLGAQSDMEDKNEQILYFTMFIAGLITANHHTGLIIMGPVFIAWISLKKGALKLNTVITGGILFFLGLLVNSYLVIRGGSSHFFNSVHIDNVAEFDEIVTRSMYRGSGTIAAATGIFHGPASYWYALKNFVSIMTSNFSAASYLVFLAGSVYLIKKNLKLSIFVLLCFIFYGPFLAKITMGGENNTEINYYIAAHQYFIPAFAIFAIVLGAGFYLLEKSLKITKLKILPRVLPLILAVFPLIFLVSRATDSSYRTNFVPYQIAKDSYSLLPSDSVFMTFGDNATYQGWYLKLVGRYREDVCQISSADQNTIDWMFQGCNEKIYGPFFSMFYSRNFSGMLPFIIKHRYYGCDPVKDSGAYAKYLNSRSLSINYLYLPADKFIINKNEFGDNVESFAKQKQLSADKLINYSVCLSHFTDDFFSRQLCSSYCIHLTNMARLYSGEAYNRTGEKIRVQIKDMRSGYIQPLYSVDITEKNRPYLEMSTRITRFNQWPILYFREKE
ncbi:MAG: DUF2723 domain-containing protein [Nitrospirae bacterium]|nr:DUF2723 domain-containing protein [Nitrospirota bacterium]